MTRTSTHDCTILYASHGSRCIENDVDSSAFISYKHWSSMIVLRARIIEPWNDSKHRRIAREDIRLASDASRGGRSTQPANLSVVGDPSICRAQPLPHSNCPICCASTTCSRSTWITRTYTCKDFVRVSTNQFSISE